MKVLVLGAGQLARMMALAGAPLGIKVVAYDVRSHTTVHPVTWENQQLTLIQALLDADVVSAEFEHIPEDILTESEASGKFLPGAVAIKAGGDRRIEKQLLDEVAVPNAKYSIINSQQDLVLACEDIGLPLVLKSALDGYDGKGQWRVKQLSEIESVWSEIEEFLSNSRKEQAIIAEQWIAFDREISVIGARSRDGSFSIYPLTHNHHESGVLALSVAPADKGSLHNQALDAFKKISEALDYVGVLAIEFFDLEGQLLVNEIAPRVHNSGHWTQQGALVCQFENHLRAVCGLALGSMDLLRPTAMINLLGIDSLPEAIYSMHDTHIHWYGKEKRPGRKMGHINIRAENKTALLAQLNAVAQCLPESEFSGLTEAIESWSQAS